MTKYSKIIAAFGVVAGLGVAALPLTSYADTSTSVTYSITVEASSSLTADGNTKTYTLANSAKSNSSQITTLTATTNNASGATIVAKSTNSSAVLQGKDTSKTIAYSTSALTAGTEGWNLTVASPGTAGIANIVESSGATIYSGSAPISATTIGITFDAATSSTTAADTYSDVVTYTLTTN